MNYLPGYKSTLELLFASTPCGVGKVFIPIQQALGRISATSTADGVLNEGERIGIDHILHLQKVGEQEVEIFLPPDVQLIVEDSTTLNYAYTFSTLMLNLIAPGFYTHIIDDILTFTKALEKAARTGDLIIWLTQEPLPTIYPDGEGGKTTPELIIDKTNCFPIEHLKVARFKNRQRTILVFDITPQLETVVATLPSIVWSVLNHLSGLKRAKNLMNIRSLVDIDLDICDSDRLGLVRIQEDGFYKISFDFTDLVGYHGLILLPRGISRIIKGNKYEIISFPGFY